MSDVGDMAVATQPARAGDVRALKEYRARTSELLDELDLERVADVVDHLFEAWRRHALIAIAGNGGSASTASHMATDLVKATRVPGHRSVRAISLSENVPLLTALANDDGYDVALAHMLDAVFKAGDVLLLISASGNSPNVVVAARKAAELGGTTIALVGFGGGKLQDLCDVVVHTRSQSGEYGPVEDVHLVLNHMISGRLLDRIRSEARS